MKSVDHLLEQITPEQKQKLLACSSIDELIQEAKSAGVDLEAEEARFHLLKGVPGEISDDDLDHVAGGKSGDLLSVPCPKCGSTATSEYELVSRTKLKDRCRYLCNSCQYRWSPLEQR